VEQWDEGRQSGWQFLWAEKSKARVRLTVHVERSTRFAIRCTLGFPKRGSISALEIGDLANRVTGPSQLCVDRVTEESGREAQDLTIETCRARQGLDQKYSSARAQSTRTHDAEPRYVSE